MMLTGTTTSTAAAASKKLRVWSHSPSRRRRRRGTWWWWSSLSAEKLTIGLLLLVAWGWISVTIGMVFFHNYTIHRNDNRHNPLVDLPAPNEEEQHSDEEEAHASAAGLSPLLIFTYRRYEYLRDTLTDVLRYIPDDCSIGCPLIVSQDGNDEHVSALIQEFQTKFRLEKPHVPVIHWNHQQQPQQLRGALARINNAAAYAALAQHYKFALDKLFKDEEETDNNSYERVLILEEDLHIAPDFFDYFQAMAPLLDADQTLLAVSAYNDNGLQGKVLDVQRVVRSDFFPGLGWMMTKRLWLDELSHKWPLAYWDDWLREPEQRQGRHILRPEVSRTFHFGMQGGASNNQYGDNLKNIQLNTEHVIWRDYQETLEESLSLDTWNQDYWKLIENAHIINSVADSHNQDQNVRLEYTNLKDFAQLAISLGIFSEEKAGVPRTAYKGVVEQRLPSGKFLFLTPAPWTELAKAFGQS